MLFKDARQFRNKIEFLVSSEVVRGKFLNNYLPTSQRAQPPSLKTGGVLLQHGKDITFSKGQLVGRLRDIVVQSSRFHAFLL